jgi:hypothetical protein
LQSAVSQVFNLPPAACEQRFADYKSAIRQIKNLRYAKPRSGILPAERSEKSTSGKMPAAPWPHSLIRSRKQGNRPADH